jgi:hypothetical protein
MSCDSICTFRTKEPCRPGIKAKSTNFKFQPAVKPDGLSLNDNEGTLAVIK